MTSTTATRAPASDMTPLVTPPADSPLPSETAHDRVSEVGAPSARWAIIGIFLLLLVAGIALSRSFLMPVVLGFLLALVFSPVRRFLERRGISAPVSALLIVGSLASLLGIGVSLLAAPARDAMEALPLVGPQLEYRIRQLRGSAEAVMEATQQVEELAEGNPAAPEVVVRGPSLLSSMVAEAPGVLAQIALILVLVMFLLASGDMFYEKIAHVMPTFKDKRQAIRIAYDIERKLSRYLFTITVINSGLGLSIGLTMWWLGLPNPALFAVLGFALNFVPYLGALIGITITTIVSLLTFPQLEVALLPGLAYFGLNVVEAQFVTPYFVGRRLEMNAVVVFLSIAFWAWLWSVAGMLVAVPMLVTIRAFCEHLPVLQPVAHFLSTRGAEGLPRPGADGSR